MPILPTPSNDESDSFRCPVCRARQTLRDECRRCRADLSLVIRAYRRIQYLRDALRTARDQRDHEREHALAAELRQLAPNR